MALFSTLSLSKSNDGSSSPSGSSSSSSLKALQLPTVVQLFTDHPFPLTVDTALHHQLQQLQLQQQQPQQQQQSGTHPTISFVNYNNSGMYFSIPPSYAALHYTAVQCQTSLQLESFTEQQRGLRQLPKKTTLTVATPDVGVWNFRITDHFDSSSNPNVHANKKLPSSTPSVSTASSLDSLLALTSSKSTNCASLRTFCMAIDLSVLENVESSITRMQEALVRHMTNMKSTAAPSQSSGDSTSSKLSFESVQTTTLFQLKKVQFGLAPEDTKSAEAMKKTEPIPSDADKTIALQICVRLPTNSYKFQEYRDQQAIALMVYHLRRYAVALSASLLFVVGAPETASKQNKDASGASASTSELSLSPSKSSDLAEASSFVLLKEQPTVPLHRLPIVWRELALGKPVWKPEACPDIYEGLDLMLTPTENTVDGEDDGDGGDANDVSASTAVVSAHSLIYGPGAQNEELIETVLLRNANYPGHWDAAKDSVWKILPKEPLGKTENTTHTTNNKKGGILPMIKPGDESWLTELRESIAVPDGMKTPPPKKSLSNVDGSTSANASTGKTPNDSAVSSFFEDLLK